MAVSVDGKIITCAHVVKVAGINYAGEATSSDYQATIHGAYLSGVRAVEEIWGA